MLSFTDQLGRIIHLKSYPTRIVSLVPSQTELLFDLGLGDEVIGITKFCVHPHQWFHSKTRVGGTKTINIDLIHTLQPDLVIANKEENTKEQIEELIENKYPVWISDVYDLETALQMITSVGEVTNREKKAISISNDINRDFAELKNNIQLNKSTSELKTAYLIWKDPYMTVGADTFIHSMLAASGFNNIFKDLTRYPEINIADMKSENCQLLLLASEPYPFRDQHVAELQDQLPGTKIMLVDGQMFSWYGSRLLQYAGYFHQAFGF